VNDTSGDDTIDVLAAAATAMPWPVDDLADRLLDYARRAVPDAEVRVQSSATPPPDVSVVFADARFLVARRAEGDPPLSHQERRVLVALASMATASRHTAQRLGRLRRWALTDDLTGLWGHAFFLEMLQSSPQWRDPGELIGVLYLDLDRFKEVNDSLGHVDADQVLRTLGSRLAEVAGTDESDDLAETGEVVVGRLGGDEFGMIVRSVSGQEDLDALVDRVREVVSAPVPVADQLVRVGVSVGTALSEHRDDDPEQLLRAADRDLRRAKSDHQDRARRTRWYDQRDVLRDLLDREGVGVAFQPLVEVESGTVLGYEALLRARHLEVGPMSPLLAVDSASRLRLLDELTEAVLGQAVDCAGKVAEETGSEVVLSVNLEHEQLRSGSRLIEELPERVRDRGVRLVLELSERSVGRWTGERDLAARTLRDQGVELAVDDFGAGYATFAMLNSWRWHWVKIDRGLVSGRDDEQSRRLLGHLCRMLGDMGTTTVAEGVETEQQLDLVADLGVGIAQGRYLAAPLLAPDVLEHVRRHGMRLG